MFILCLCAASSWAVEEEAAVLAGAFPRRDAQRSYVDAAAEALQRGQRELKLPHVALLCPVNLLPVQRRDRRPRLPFAHLHLASRHFPHQRSLGLFRNRGSSLP